MMQQPAVNRNAQRQQTATTYSVPSPVGGWNDRDSLANMPEKDAVILDNYFPYPSKVAVRKGRTTWATGMTGQVESLMPYNPQTGTAALFGAVGTNIYNVTAAGAVGGAVVSSLTNARFQHVNMGTSGGQFLMAVNGADKLRGWSGSAWWIDGDGAHDITGVDTATCIGIQVFKHRLWLIKKNTLSVYYLPVDSIAGAAVQIDLAPLCSKGGQLMAMARWSLDAGDGADDYAAFITDQGEVLVFQGTDPSSVATWAERGRYLIGEPVGRRCFGSLAGDVMVINQDGLVPLSRALQVDRVNTQIALTDKIQNATSAVITNYGSTYGWEVLSFPGENMIILNVPIAVGQQQQYVMNTITGAWCRFKGWDANCFALFGGLVYMGGNGKTYKAWTTTADAGTNINAEALQAFSYLGSKSGLKEVTMVRPVLAISNQPGAGLKFGVNVDFDQTAPTGTPTAVASTAATWGSSKWNAGLWSGAPVIQKAWQGANGVGYCAALHILSASNSSTLEWSSTDYAFKKAGIL